MDDKPKNVRNQSETPQILQAEEVAADIQTPEEISGSIPPNFEVPIYEERHSKFGFILGMIVVFLVIFGVVFWVFFKDRFFASVPNPIVKKKPVTLTYWGLWDEPAIYQSVIDEYQKKNKHVTIKYEQVSPEQYRQRLIARSKTGKGPDIFRFHNTWLPEIQEVITAIPPEVMSNEEFEKTFYPIHTKDLKIANKYYGIPLMIDGTVLIYNTNLLKQAGFVSPPTVWVGDQNDVLSYVNAMTVRDSSNAIITSGMAIGTASNVEHFGEIFGILLLLNGGDLKKLDQPEAAEALGLYRKFAEENYWSESLPNSDSAFIEGKVAMILAPSWHVMNIKARNPDLPIKVTTVPKGLNNASVSIANYWVEGVNKNSPNQTEAWAFLKFLVQKENLAKINEAQVKTRPLGMAYSRRDMAELLKENEYLSAVIQQAQEDSYITLPLVSRTYDQGLDDDILLYIQNAINQTKDGVSYQSALSTTKKGIDQVFKNYKIE